MYKYGVATFLHKVLKIMHTQCVSARSLPVILFGDTVFKDKELYKYFKVDTKLIPHKTIVISTTMCSLEKQHTASLLCILYSYSP